MITETLQIKRYLGDDKYTVIYEPSNIKRVKHTPKPNKLGFYHFDKKLGPEKAFDELKQFLIEAANKEISSLQEYIDNIKALELPDRIINYKPQY